MMPTTNCSHRNGKGEMSLPNNVSRINLMPPAAIRPGISITMNAAKRAMHIPPHT